MFPWCEQIAGFHREFQPARPLSGCLQAVAKAITDLASSPHLDDKFRPWRAGRSP
jgi:hypothetical protein